MNKPVTVSPKTYLIIYIALILLLGATFGLAHIQLKSFGVPMALFIASAKALLVVLYFMHVRMTAGIQRVAVGVGVFWLGILMTLSLSDYISRDWLTFPGHWPQ